MTERIERRRFVGWMGAAGAATLLGRGSRAAAQGGPTRIGVIFPLSGNLALLGDESFRGCELARLRQNEKGGVKGRQVEFVVGDGPNPTAAVNEAERLITKEGVRLMVGTYASSISFAVTAVASKHKVTFMETTAVADNIMQRGFPYLWRVTTTTTDFGDQAAKYAVELAPKLGVAKDALRLAVVYEDTLFGTSVAEAAVKRAKQLGVNVAAQESYNAAKAVDLSPVILRLKSARPDVVVHTAYLTDAILFWRQAKELKLDLKAALGTSAGYGITGFADALGKDADGIMSVDYTQWRTHRKFAVGLPEFIDRYKKKYGTEPRSGQSLASYDAVNVLFMGLEGAKSPEPDDLREAMLRIDVPAHRTATGWGVKFDPKTGQNMRNILTVFQWKDKAQWTVLPEEARLPQAELTLPLPPWDKR